MALEITPEKLNEIDIKQILLNKDKFGVLIFDKSYSLLESLKKLILEFQDYGYRENLTQQEITIVDQFINQFVTYLQRIDAIDPETNTEFNHTFRDNLDREIEAFSNNFQVQLRTPIIYLRQEAALRNTDQKSLQDEQRQLTRIKKEYQENIDNLKKQLQDLQKQKGEVESSHGEIGAIRFGKHFESEANDYENSAAKWLLERSKILLLLEYIIAVNFIVYFYLFIADKANWWPHFPPADFFTVEYLIIKVAAISLLWYLVSFNSKNYSIASNLSTINKHRKNVAETLTDFLATNPDEATRSLLVKNGTESMFKNTVSGYLSKDSKDSSTIFDIANNIMPGKKE